MLAVQVIIARNVGVTGAGRVATAMTITALLAVVGRYGADQLIMRRVAASSGHDEVRTQYQNAIRASIAYLIGTGAVLTVAAGPIADHVLGDPGSAAPLRWLAIALPAFGLTAVQGEAIKGAGAPVLGATVQSVVGPVLSLAVLAVTWGSASVQVAAASVAIGYVGASIAAHIGWKVLNPGPGPVGERDVPGFRREAGPFFANSIYSMLLLYAPILALALLADPEDVGRYFAAERWTQIPSMMLVAINSTVGPLFARAWSARRVDEVRSLLLRSTRATLPLAIVVALALMIGAPWLLGLFGDEYPEAANALRVLGLAQGFVLACGPITSLLVMSGGERAQRRASATAVVVVVVASAALVPSHGVLGAAIASGVALVVNKLLVVLAAREALKRTVTGA